MNRLVALTRSVPDSLPACELTHLARAPIDVSRARAQHAEYERALGIFGCEVTHLPPAHDLPDSVFVEDTAIVLDELAIVAKPGAWSRRAETTSVAEALAIWRRLEFLTEPATLDGGDVLRLGRTLYVGIGSRSNGAGADQLDAAAHPHGYCVRRAEVVGCLHLKSAVTELAPGLVLLNPAWVSRDTFEGHDAIEVDEGEPFAANVLRIGGRVLAAAACRRTNARLRAAGLEVEEVDVSELAKAEAGVTCCSLIVAA